MSSFERPFGRYFEEFEVGDVYRHWPGKTITEADDHLFCMITMNHHPLHTNAWFAEHETVHHKNVVVGNLVYSLVLGMSVPDVSGSAIANLEVESLVHRNPTFHGDTIYAETTRPGDDPVDVQERSGHRHRRDQGLQSGRTRGLLLPPQGDGLEARVRAAATTSVQWRRLVVTTSWRFDERCVAARPRLARPLPWIGHADPWAVLVSEVMLQQTQTSRVIGPWTRFMAAFPTPTACADAPLADVLRLWSGLGYHRRAKALHDAARMIRDEFGGVVPDEVADLRRLPGIGEYTANAVASFAFGRRVAVVDTNVGRVLARALDQSNAERPRGACRANELLPRTNAASFNQAMLDLGAQFCTSTPRCATCPVARVCKWHREGGADPAPRSAGVSRPQSTFAGIRADRRVGE